MSRAVIYEKFGGPEVLELRDVPEPHAGTGEVRVRVAAIGLNPMDPGIASMPDLAAMFGVSVPSGFGYDFADVIDEIGAGVEGFAVGDRIFGGAMAKAAADFLVLKSPTLPPDAAFHTPAGGIGRHVKVKAPDGRERTSVALGLHHDELDSAFPIPVAIFGEQSGPESPPTPLPTPNPELFMGDDESRTAKPNLARGVADDLIGLIGDDRQVAQSARPIWQTQLATQNSAIIRRASAISALISRTSKCSPPNANPR